MVPGSRERGRGCGRDDSECLQLQHLQRRRRSATRGVAVPSNCAGVAVRPVCMWCGGGGASTSARRTGIAAEAITCCGAVTAEEYARANEVLRGALWPQPAAQQALQRVSVSLSHMLAADLGAAFGAMASVPPVGGARITAASALGLRPARSSFT